MPERSVWIGFDPREAAAFAVCRHSMERRLTQPIPVNGIVLSKLQRSGIYTRPLNREWLKKENEDGTVEWYEQLWDVISDAPMSTEFAVSRFFAPFLAKSGWALFTDCDVLARVSLARLFEISERKTNYAVLVVKHDHVPDLEIKMDGQAQTRYDRKNWSSVCMWNVEHPANQALTLEVLNTWPGRDLHAFKWLDDSQIGELDPTWNYLVGHTKTEERANLVHFTDGVPGTHRGFADVEYADEYREELELWAK